MSRQEASNTFTDGLISDLNPINTPASVVTDALNATFITYNGNEFVLQNDMGNYPLQYCKLPSNFIPVGTSTYADTLYVVSHNPITHETEIGTYPSPQTIFTTDDRDQGVVFTPLVDGVIGLNNNYTDLIQNAKLQIYALSSDMESYKLNPGDKFLILLGDEDAFPYQTIDYRILNDNKELIPINIPLNEGYIWPLASNPSSEDFKNVFWKIPGWLTGKYRLAVMDQFYLNVRGVTLPEFVVGSTFDVSDIQINTQIEVTDELFRNNPLKNADTLRDLKVEYTTYTKNGGTTSMPTAIGTLSEHSYNSSSDIYYNNLTFKASQVSTESIIIVEAVPFIEYDGSRIYYDQFKTSVEINLTSVNSANDINAANVTYRYTIDDSGISLTFNVEGPFINNSEIVATLELYNLCGSGYQKVQWDDGWDGKLVDINLLGQNTVNLPFTNDTSGSNTKFTKENMYVFSIVFSEGTTQLKRINKLLIVSELFAKFTDIVDFGTITTDRWMGEYSSILSTATANLSSNSENILVNSGAWLNSGYQSWLNGVQISPQSQIILPTTPYYWYYNSLPMPTPPIYQYGSKYDIPLVFTSNQATLSGCLWQNIDQTIVVSGNMNGVDFGQVNIPSANIKEYTFTKSAFFGETLLSKYVPVTGTYSTIVTENFITELERYPLKTERFHIIEDYMDQQGGKRQVNGRRYHYSILPGITMIPDGNPIRSFFPYIDRGDTVRVTTKSGWNSVLTDNFKGLGLYILRWQIQNHNEVSFSDPFGADWNTETDKTFIYAMLPSVSVPSAVAIPFENSVSGIDVGRTELSGWPDNRLIPDSIFNSITKIQNSIKMSSGHSSVSGIFVDVTSEIATNDSAEFTELTFQRNTGAIRYRSKSLLSSTDVATLNIEINNIANNLSGAPITFTNATSNLTLTSNITIPAILKNLPDVMVHATVTSSTQMGTFKTWLDTELNNVGTKQQDALNSDPIAALPESGQSFYISENSDDLYIQTLVENLVYDGGRAKVKNTGSPMAAHLDVASGGIGEFVYCAQDVLWGIPLLN